MDRTPEVPGPVRWVVRTLEEAGHETWAVGGAVRNALLGIPSGDWDLATRAPPTVVRRLFPRTVPIGIEHGTVGVLARNGTLLEVTTFRRDLETFGRRATVEFAETLEEDLSRRDFTVNAIAFHPLRKEWKDPYGGRRDLDEGILRTVGDPSLRFAEDYLRVLRGLRFSGGFRFRIEERTWQALCAATVELGILSPERIRDELLKILRSHETPSASLVLYGASGALAVLYPELSAVGGCRRPASGEDLWVHSLLLTDLLPSHRPRIRLAALLHGLGVPGDEGGEESAAGLRGRDRAAALLFRMRFSNAEVGEVTELVGAGPEPPLALATPAEVRSWLHQTGARRLPGLARLWLAKARLDQARWGRDPHPILGLLGRIRGELHEDPPLTTQELAVDGRDLISMGLKPGPRFGVILDALMERVLEDPSHNRKDVLLKLVEKILEEKS